MITKSRVIKVMNIIRNKMARLGTRKYLAQKMKEGQGGRVIISDDDKTCPECRAKSGKYSNATPPFHPNCRCRLG